MKTNRTVKATGGGVGSGEASECPPEGKGRVLAESENGKDLRSEQQNEWGWDECCRGVTSVKISDFPFCVLF